MRWFGTATLCGLLLCAVPSRAEDGDIDLEFLGVPVISEKVRYTETEMCPPDFTFPESIYCVARDDMKRPPERIPLQTVDSEIFLLRLRKIGWTGYEHTLVVPEFYTNNTSFNERDTEVMNACFPLSGALIHNYWTESKLHENLVISSMVKLKIANNPWWRPRLYLQGEVILANYDEPSYVFEFSFSMGQVLDFYNNELPGLVTEARHCAHNVCDPIRALIDGAVAYGDRHLDMRKGHYLREIDVDETHTKRFDERKRLFKERLE